MEYFWLKYYWKSMHNLKRRMHSERSNGLWRIKLLPIKVCVHYLFQFFFSNYSIRSMIIKHGSNYWTILNSFYSKGYVDLHLSKWEFYCFNCTCYSQNADWILLIINLLLQSKAWRTSSGQLGWLRSFDGIENSIQCKLFFWGFKMNWCRIDVGGRIEDHFIRSIN